LTTLIVPNKLISQDYASVIRNIITNGLLEIRDYSRLSVFKSTAVYPVTIIIKNENQSQFVNMISMHSVYNIKETNRINRNELKVFPWDAFFWDLSFISILRKVNGYRKLMGELVRFENSCTVSEAYEIKKILLDKNQKINMRKFINSGTIDPYLSWWGIKNTSYIKDRYKHPVIADKELNKLNPRRFSQSQSKKIIVANMTRNLEAFLDSKAEYLAGKSTIIAVGNYGELIISTALLNSRLISFWYKCIYHSTKMSGEALSVSTGRLSNLPIPEIPDHSKKLLSKYVESILSDKDKDSFADTSDVERQIDNLVYRLYNLTYDEVKVIEPEFPLSRAEYESVKMMEDK
jgi:hypothetical protein